MITTLTLKDYPEMQRVVRAAFPSYKKHKVMYFVTDTVELSGTYWDGGSRSTYVAVDLVSGRSQGAPHYDPPQFGGPRTTPHVTLPLNVAIVEAGTFCGKPATALVFIHPENVARLLPDLTVST